MIAVAFSCRIDCPLPMIFIVDLNLIPTRKFNIIITLLLKITIACLGTWVCSDMYSLSVHHQNQHQISPRYPQIYSKDILQISLRNPDDCMSKSLKNWVAYQYKHIGMQKAHVGALNMLGEYSECTQGVL